MIHATLGDVIAERAVANRVLIRTRVRHAVAVDPGAIRKVAGEPERSTEEHVARRRVRADLLADLKLVESAGGAPLDATTKRVQLTGEQEERGAAEQECRQHDGDGGVPPGSRRHARVRNDPEQDEVHPRQDRIAALDVEPAEQENEENAGADIGGEYRQ